MNEEPKKGLAQKPHFGRGAHFFNLQNFNQLSPEERKKVIERMLSTMEEEQEKQQEGQETEADGAPAPDA